MDVKFFHKKVKELLMREKKPDNNLSIQGREIYMTALPSIWNNNKVMV